MTKANIYTMQQLQDALNDIDTFRYTSVGPDVFFDYCSTFDLFYKPFVSGTIQKNHKFWVTKDHPTTMLSQLFDGHEDPPVAYNRKKLDDANRIIFMKAYENKQLVPPGLREIKMYELWKKWGPFVPEQFRDEICPKPSNAAIARVKEERAKKAKDSNHAKKAAAKEQATKTRTTSVV